MIRRIVLALLLSIGLALAATPTFNNSVQASDVDGGASATTGTLTANAGSNRFLEVTFAVGAGSPAAHSSVTWGGQSLTQRGSTLTVGGSGRLSKWFLKEANFPGGATGTVTVTAASGQDEVWVVAVIYNDVDQANPYKNVSLTTNPLTNSNSGTVTVTSDATCLVTGSTWGIDASGTVTAIISTAGTERQATGNFGTLGYEAGSVADITGGASNATLSWTYTVVGTMDDQGSIGDALSVATGGGGGGATSAGRRALSHVGF